MKQTFIIALLIPLIFGGSVHALDKLMAESLSDSENDQSDYSEVIISPLKLVPVDRENQTINSMPSTGSLSDPGMSSPLSSNIQTLEDTATTITWPALPGESLKDIARLFYPKSNMMRQHFIAETLALNAEMNPKLQAINQFSEPTLLQIPTLKSLSQKASVIQSKRAKANRQKMKLSYRMNQAVSKIPAFLLHEYEALLAKNAFLKAELERLQIRLGILQEKLVDLKLIFDKTMSLTANSASSENIYIANSALKAKINSNDINNAEQQVIVTSPQTNNIQLVKKVFKNLSASAKTVSTNQTGSVGKLASTSKLVTESTIKPIVNWIKYGLMALLSFLVIFTLSTCLMRKRRQRTIEKLSDAVPKMDDTLADFSGQWYDTDPDLGSKLDVDDQLITSANGFLNTNMRIEQAQTLSALEEAKLLMSINRFQNAIDHLKQAIEEHPKSSLHLCLYLLEIYRKQNAKDEFEQYAQTLHQTFNVMKPVWYETNVAMIIAQHLEDFPHIIENLVSIWPSASAISYLEGLLTDNRDGERAGFSQAVMCEIMMLIALLETRKTLDLD